MLVLLCASATRATDVSGDQAGTWTLAGSPYYLVGDVRVPPGQQLTIEPGVQVIARGYYRFTVEQGVLQALGSEGRPILFTAENTAQGWRGLRLMAADDRSEIRHCIVEYAKGTGDFPEVRGGGIYVQGCSPRILHNELRFNYSHNGNYNGAGGGIATESSSALVAYNTIHENQADSGGGICCMEYGSPRLIGNLVVDNTGFYAGGGMYFGARSSPTVERNTILRNTAGGWGGGGINSWTSFIFYGTFPTIRNNIIAKNRSTSGSEACGGGGVYCRYDRAVLVGNTIAENQAVVGGGIYALNYAPQAPLVTDCVVWGNTAPTGPQIYLYPTTPSEIVVSYSDVQGGWTGVGNINDDPRFLAPGSDDYHLTPLSPCIDRGDPAFAPQPGELDIDGQRRVWDGDGNGSWIVDMGADEFGSFAYGDTNCDGQVNFGDINPFVLALVDPGAYAAMFPNCNILNGDINADGAVDFRDINPFVAVLSG
jgi:hypothetical protein